MGFLDKLGMTLPVMQSEAKHPRAKRTAEGRLGDGFAEGFFHLGYASMSE